MEIPNSTVGRGRRPAYATQNQKDYIYHLLDLLDADLTEYTDTDPDSLTMKEASDLIDELKDDVTSASAWPDDDF